MNAANEDQVATITMPAIMVGGCADGVIIPKLPAHVGLIELKRPDFIKPLLDPSQTVPEVAHVSDRYEIHPMSLTNSDKPREAVLFGIGVVEGQSLTWAFTKIMAGYTHSVMQKLHAAGALKTLN